MRRARAVDNDGAKVVGWTSGAAIGLCYTAPQISPQIVG